MVMMMLVRIFQVAESIVCCEMGRRSGMWSGDERVWASKKEVVLRREVLRHVCRSALWGFIIGFYEIVAVSLSRAG